MATKSSIHIKPCNIASSEAHNRRTAEYMRNIGESRIYVVPELSTDNEQWINPDFGTPELRTHYDNIKQMVKEKTGRAMQEKERERKGKSTMLRIVSGALNPSGGKVVVDRRKVQLLTLGTGFDMELTARENIYLNGAIIGYSKKFIDEHFDEIIDFAELQDFVDEKVKNFSSGMVSRLGFAIATAGDAAEILILDEVLSVGDEFFRKNRAE